MAKAKARKSFGGTSICIHHVMWASTVVEHPPKSHNPSHHLATTNTSKEAYLSQPTKCKLLGHIDKFDTSQFQPKEKMGHRRNHIRNQIK